MFGRGVDHKDRNKKVKNIGFLGLALHSGNKGCEALSYSFLGILNEIGKKNNILINAYMLVPCTIKEIAASFIIKERMYVHLREKFKSLAFSNVTLEFLPYYKKMQLILPNVKKLDCVFDFTAGDSFTDLYGEERFYSRTAIKEKVMQYRIPLVLGSQTIGPFENEAVRKRAVAVIKQSAEVFVRDVDSYEYVKKISGRQPVLTTDVAFLLPYKKPQRKDTSGIRIGFNPSGLLWKLEKTAGNKINLRVDYQDYCCKVVEYLISKKQYDVELIVHSYTSDLDNTDNDLVAVNDLKQRYPQLKLAPLFETPVEAKSYISSLDIFVGARMHATIAAYSSGVPVIPFSYSRKFEGLYKSLEYPYVIHGTSESTEAAVNHTIEWIEQRGCLAESRSCQEMKVQDNNQEIIKQYEKIVMGG